jgi:hypothetical protein
LNIGGRTGKPADRALNKAVVTLRACPASEVTFELRVAYSPKKLPKPKSRACKFLISH